MMPSPEPLAIRFARALLRCASILVPQDDRAAWLQEWEAEILHHCAEHGGRGRAWATHVEILRRVPGALVDAAWLRRHIAFDMNIARDVRQARRTIAAHPAFALTAAAVLALAIGASTAVFSVVDTLMLRQLPYRDPDRIVTVWQRQPTAGIERGEVSPGNFIDWTEQATMFEAMAGVEPFSFDYTGGAEPETLRGAIVTRGFFEALGVEALHGRTFLTREYAAHSQVVMLTHGCWMRRFGGDPALVGRPIPLDEGRYTVVGILPADFAPNLGQEPHAHEVWAPRIIRDHDRASRGGGFWNVVARLKPGVTLEQAQHELASISRRLAERYPRTNADVIAHAVPLADHLVASIRTPLFVLLGAVALVLLIACANVANLLLARGAGRQHELAVRAALGASRGALMRQLLIEGLILSALACAGGIALAWGAVDVMVALAPPDSPRIGEVRIDWRIASFAVLLSAGTALIFGTVPAFVLSRANASDAMKERTSSSGVRRARLRATFVIAELAFSVVLLAAAGLLLRSFGMLLRVDPGFARENVMALQVFAYGQKYRKAEQQTAFFDQALERIRAVAGVERAGVVSAMPFIAANINIESPFHVEGRAPLPAAQQASTFVTSATGDYFRAMRIPLRRGRLFDSRDTGRTKLVAVISEVMARRHWPGEDPVGRRVTLRWQGARTVEIVGVVGQVRHDGLDREPRPEVFLPHAQAPFGAMTFVVRTRADAARTMKAVKEEIWRVDPAMPFYDSATIEHLIANSLTPRRFSLVLLGSFAGVALILALVGIYAVISFSTMQRTREIGVRIAMGAQSRDISRLVVRQAVVLAGGGVCAGIMAALVLTRFLRSLLFDVSPGDPLTLISVAALLFGVALVASYIPARRATRLDPLLALRYD